MEEIFDVIDKKGNVLCTETRSIVHSKGLLHKSVHGFVLDGKGRIFVQQRSFDKDLEPGKWDASVAEHLKPGETFKEAFVRGVKEELGVQAKDVEKVGERRCFFDFGEKHDHELVEIFKSGFKGKIRLQEEEVEQGKWIEKQDLLNEMAYSKEIFTRWLLGDRKFAEML